MIGVMKNLAQFGYSDPAQQNGRDAILSQLHAASALRENDLSNSTSHSATNGADTDASFSNNFDFAAYGKSKDLEAAANDSGYTNDQDREMAVEQKPNMAMGIDLDKLEKLQSMGIPNEVIMKSRGQLNELSVEEMAEQYRESGELTKEAAAAKEVDSDQMKEIAADFQKSMSVDNSEQAKDGVSAMAAGASQSVGVARMAFA